MAMRTDVTLDTIRTTGQMASKDTAVWITHAAYSTVPDGAIFAQQGDIYLRKLGTVPRDAVPIRQPYRQLVPGESLGSRHCLDSLDGVTMFLPKDRGPLDGPIVACAVSRSVTHPKHGDICGIPAHAIFQVRYQRLYADEVRRVMD